MKELTPVNLGRRALLQGGTLVLLLGPHLIARGAAILAVRVWPSTDYSRVTLESDAELKTHTFFVAEPDGSPVISQTLAGEDLTPGPHKIQGAGAGFIPENLRLKNASGENQITECIKVSNEEAFTMARRHRQAPRQVRQRRC